MGEYTEPHQLFPNYWANAAGWLLTVFPRLGAGADESEAMMRDLIERCTGIEPLLPCNPDSPVHRKIGLLMVDAIEAEQRLFAAKPRFDAGEKPGYWPATELETDHPFLVAFRRVVTEIETEANAAVGTRGLN